LKLASQVSSCWPYTHDKFEDEVFIENAQDWDKVVARMVDPKITKFKAMILEEHTATIEKLAQETLRAREENDSDKSSRSPLDGPDTRQRFPYESGRARERVSHDRTSAMDN
jgi:hypothetical protein